MKRITIFLVVASLAACSQAPAPTENQAALAPERVGTKSFDYGVGVAVDKQRNAVYAVVSTDGSLAGKNLGGRDTFLQRYKRNGEIVWSRQFGSADDDYVTDIAVDETRGFVYVVRKRFANEDGTGENVSFLYKYGANGKQLLKHKIELEGRTDLWVSTVTVDNRGDVYVGGVGDNEFEPYAYIQKLSGNGTVLWDGILADTELGGSTVTALATDSARNVYVAVQEADDYVWTSIVKLSANGNGLKFEGNIPSRNVSAYYDTVVTDFAVEGTSLYATGYYSGAIDCDDCADLPEKGFFLKFSPSGSLEQNQTLDGKWRPAALSADGKGNVFMTGSVGQNGNDKDPFLRKYNRSRVQWTKRFGSREFDSGNDVAAYNSGELYVIGSTQGAIGNGTNRGGEDAFVSRLNGSGKLVWTDQ